MLTFCFWTVNHHCICMCVDNVNSSLSSFCVLFFWFREWSYYECTFTGLLKFIYKPVKHITRIGIACIYTLLNFRDNARTEVNCISGPTIFSHHENPSLFHISVCSLSLYPYYISQRWVSVMFLASTFTVLFKVRCLLVLAWSYFHELANTRSSLTLSFTSCCFILPS